MADKQPLLQVEHLCKEFPVDSGVFASRMAKKVSAVDDVSSVSYTHLTLPTIA